MRKLDNRTPRTSTKTKRAAKSKRSRKRSDPVSTNGAKHAKMKPFYDSELRRLYVGTTEVKRFMQASDAQEILVLVFQEENWRRRIDDPLPVKHNQDPPQRLRAAVCNLNRRQHVPLLHSRVIHKGTGVAWQFREGNDAKTQHRRPRDSEP